MKKSITTVGNKSGKRGYSSDFEELYCQSQQKLTNFKLLAKMKKQYIAENPLDQQDGDDVFERIKRRQKAQDRQKGAESDLLYSVQKMDSSQQKGQSSQREKLIDDLNLDSPH